MRLQSNTSGERAKASAALTAVIACQEGSGQRPEGNGWGQRSSVAAITSIRLTLLNADGSRPAQVPRGSHCGWPGRA